jgi:hypothetical protein
MDHSLPALRRTASQAGRRRFDPGRPLSSEPVEDKGFLHLRRQRVAAHPGGFRKGSGLAAPSRRSSRLAARRRHGRRRSASRSSRGSCRSGGRRTGASPRRRAAWRCRCGGSGRRGVVPLDAIWSLGSARGSSIDREWSSLRASLGRGLHHVISFPAVFVLPSAAEPTIPAQLQDRRRQKRLGGPFFLA